MTRTAQLISGLLLIATVTAFAQEVAPSAASVATALERELKSARVPGASFAIVSGDEVVIGSYGLADVERASAMTPDTLLQVGSLNKLMTALALGATLDARKISLVSPLGKQVPDLSPRLAAVTFHQLLSQTAGLRDQPGVDGTSDESALASRVRAIGDADFVVPAGTTFSYSNLGYATAGFALEYLRKRPFADALRDALLAPLGLRSTTMRPSDVDKHPHAVGHTHEQSTTVALRAFDNDTSIWPAGYLWSNARELSAVVFALAHDGRNNAGLSPSLFTRVMQPHTSMPNVFVGGHYGYGLMRARDRGVLIYEHGGTQRGFSAMLRVAPERRLGLVMLTNLDNAPLRRVAQAVMGEALRLPAEAPTTRNDTPVSAQDLASFVGVYRNRGTAEIAVRDSQVVLILDGGAPMAVSRLGDHRYLARPKPGTLGPEFVLQPATATAPAYLHFALWAYAR